MTTTPTPTAVEIADMLLDPDTPDTEITTQLTERLGGRAARRLLAAAHGIAAERLWAAA